MNLGNVVSSAQSTADLERKRIELLQNAANEEARKEWLARLQREITSAIRSAASKGMRCVEVPLYLPDENMDDDFEDDVGLPTRNVVFEEYQRRHPDTWCLGPAGRFPSETLAMHRMYTRLTNTQEDSLVQWVETSGSSRNMQASIKRLRGAVRKYICISWD